MLRLLALPLILATLTACNFRRATPDESQVESFPEWEPAPNNDLPKPQ